MDKTNEYLQLRLRFPADIKERVKTESARRGRSMNSEVVVILRKHYERITSKRANLAQRGAV